LFHIDLVDAFAIFTLYVTSLQIWIWFMVHSS
jgi:hypothetical protein